VNSTATNPNTQPGFSPVTDPLVSVESEISLLHEVLNGKSLHGAVLEGLQPGMFAHMTRGWIFAAMLDLYQSDQSAPLGADVVIEALKRRNELDVLIEQGKTGAEFIHWLKDEAASKADGSIRDYARIIRNKHTRRMMDKRADDLKQMARDERIDPVVQIERHERALKDIKPLTLDREFTAGKDSASRHYDMLSEMAEREAWELAPWQVFTDKEVVILEGWTVVVVGPEGSGKSSMLHNWAMYCAEKVPTVYIFTEMNTKEVLDRRSVSETKAIRYAALQKPDKMSETDWQIITDTMTNEDPARMNLHYLEAGNLHEDRLFLIMQRLVDDFGVVRFVIDYANDIERRTEKGKTDALSWRDFFARLEEFNKQNRTITITAAQLNEKGEAYAIGKALRQKVQLYLMLKPEVLDREFTFVYDGVTYGYSPGDFHPIFKIEVQKNRGGRRFSVDLLYVGARYLWQDVPAGMLTQVDFRGYGDTETNTKIDKKEK
jgi:replicative DNA helicase